MNVHAEASAMDLPFFSFANLKCVLWSFCRGLTDSLKFQDVFVLDDRTDQDRVEKIIQNNYKKEFLLNRESPNRELESLAKRRAVERREQLENVAKKSETKGNKEPRILERTGKCCLLNGVVFCFSIFLFDMALIPFVRAVIMFAFGQASGVYLCETIFPVLNITFATLWILPIYLLSKVVNAIWFADIADVAFKKSAAGRPRLMNSLSISLADTVFSIVVELIFLVQGNICTYIIPIAFVGQAVNMFHMCLLHSLYCFEYKWFNQGLELHKRLSYIENHWPYFLGFGLPLAIVTSLPSSQIVSGCFFSVLFPLFIVSGNQAQVVVQPNDVPIRIFHPTIVLSNAIFARTLQKTSPKQIQHQQQQRRWT